MKMRTKLIAALAAGGCLLGLQATALAQDLAEHPPFATPSGHYRSATGARLYNYYGPSVQCDGNYNPYNDTCYPFGFQGPWH
jgi:hypothetical protein